MTAGLAQMEKTTDDGPQTTAGEIADNRPQTDAADPPMGDSLPAVGGQESTRPSSVVAPYEYLLLDAGRRILEGSGTNFWAVRDGVVYTAGEGVLEGITREIVLQLISELGIPLRLEAVSADEIGSLDEAALSGSSRAFMPVVSIAGQQIGDGQPGPITRRILVAYNTFVAENIRTAI
jgi:branched-chain amino acid aminotransferase